MAINNQNLNEDFLQEVKTNNGGFRVPVGYFDEFSIRMNESIVKNQSKNNFWLWTGSAVTVCFVVLVTLFLNTSENEKIAQLELDAYSDEMLLELVDEEDVIDFLVYDESNY